MRNRMALVIASVIGLGSVLMGGSVQAATVAASSVRMMPADCNTKVSFSISTLQRGDGKAAQLVMHAKCPEDLSVFTQLKGSSQLVPVKRHKRHFNRIPLPTMQPGQYYRVRVIVMLDHKQHVSRWFNVSRVVPTNYAKHLNRPTAIGLTRQFYMDLSVGTDEIIGTSHFRLKLTNGRLLQGSADLIGPASRLVEFRPVRRDAKVDIGSSASGGFVFTDATSKPRYSLYVDAEYAD